jgi:hypothetical protein
MDERATFLVPDRGLDSRSYPLIVEVLDGMPSREWPFFQGVVDDVGPDDGRFEDPAVGKVPAQSCAKDCIEHVDHAFLRAENIVESSVSRRYVTSRSAKVQEVDHTQEIEKTEEERRKAACGFGEIGENCDFTSPQKKKA